VFFEHIVSKANDIVMVAEVGEADGRFRIAYVNEAFSKAFGYTSKEAIGQSPRMLQGPETDETVIDEISSAVHDGRQIRRRLLNYSKNGDRVWVEVNIVPLASMEQRVTHFAAIERDVTADVMREVALEDLALTDPLTKIGNRRFFDQTLDRELARCRRTQAPLALAFVDLDHFKSVNDVWGHQAGDKILSSFAVAAHRSVRVYDYLARIGGEEFAVILPGAGADGAVSVMERMCATVRATKFAVTEDKSIRVTCSAGIASFAPTTDSLESFLERADRALYQAKLAGRDRVVRADA